MIDIPFSTDLGLAALLMRAGVGPGLFGVNWIITHREMTVNAATGLTDERLVLEIRSDRDQVPNEASPEVQRTVLHRQWHGGDRGCDGALLLAGRAEDGP